MCIVHNRSTSYWPSKGSFHNWQGTLCVVKCNFKVRIAEMPKIDVYYLYLMWIFSIFDLSNLEVMASRQNTLNCTPPTIPHFKPKRCRVIQFQYNKQKGKPITYPLIWRKGYDFLLALMPGAISLIGATLEKCARG